MWRKRKKINLKLRKFASLNIVDHHRIELRHLSLLMGKGKFIQNCDYKTPKDWKKLGHRRKDVKIGIIRRGVDVETRKKTGYQEDIIYQ
jgi:hypothetical protein